MNAGYLTMGLTLIFFILFTTGWKELIAERIPMPYLTLVASGCILLTPFSVTFNKWMEGHGSLAVQLSVCWLTAWAVAALLIYRHEGALQRVYALFASLLSAMMGGWLRILYLNDPVLIFYNATFDAAIMTGLSAVLMAPANSTMRFVVVTLASVIQPILVGWLQPGHPMQGIVIGSLAWWDSYLLALFTTCVIGLVFKMMRTFAEKWRFRFAGSNGREE
ncbi:hypothetical protein DFQ01_104128 [Paenibacillus cellulosilyticus]|uniref:Uncharacterized protein n=1 Tax=Paenibacillus cellulosilyticus TaxID=375489 RepID=A0A2V2Z053_9BACL|nr:hypothetical protein [Paenibacillus cellulosilyticus]PWW05568.1 hypothetical protein DFQ01_104128 [Paenibacillus cellulosilyticus]QKS45396.1 hypothetical protein HUB94_13940 [Paenibacillus cellulosilyticus]